MTITELIKNRTSNSKFSEKDVDIDLIYQLLNLASYAPNHKMRQNWRFIILKNTNKENFKSTVLDHFPSDEKEGLSILLDKAFVAPLIIYFIMNRNDNFDDDIEDLQALAAFTQNFLLLLEDNNLSSFWKTPKYIQSDRFKEVLELSTNEIVSHFVMIGYSDMKNKPKPREDIKNKVKFI